MVNLFVAAMAWLLLSVLSETTSIDYQHDPDYEFVEKCLTPLDNGGRSAET